MPHEIERLLPRHFVIMDLVLAGLGPTDIARELSMSPVGVGLIVNAPIFQSELARRRSQANVGLQESAQQEMRAAVSRAKSILEGAANQAASVQTELLECGDPSIRLRASDSILDRVLGKSAEVHRPTIVIDKAVIANLQLALVEAA